jgi:hypothetical protein
MANSADNAPKSTKEKCVDWVISIAHQGDRLWVVVVLLLVSITNTLTAGMLIWSVGALQGTLFTLVVMSRSWRTFWVGPLCLTLGSFIGAVTTIQIWNNGGAEALLEKAGAAGSTWLHRTQDIAASWGVLGLAGIQAAPFLPVPTAVLVLVGKLSLMEDHKILAVVGIGKLVQLLAASVAIRLSTEGMTAEEYLRSSLRGENKNIGEKAKEYADASSKTKGGQSKGNKKD